MENQNWLRGRIQGGILFAFVVANAVLFLRHIAVCLSFRFPMDYREGVVLNWIRQVVSGNSLYPPVPLDGAYLHNPYTPLFCWICGFLQRFCPDARPFLARIISTLAMIVSAGLIWRIVKHRAGVKAGFLSAALFLFSPVVVKYGCLEMVDMLALAFGLAGIYFIDHRKNRPGVFLAGIFCAAALMTKQTFVLPAAAVLIGLSARRDGSVRIFLPAFAAALFAGLGSILVHDGANVFRHLVAMNALPWSFRHFVSVVSNVSGVHAFIFAALALLISSGRGNRGGVFGWYCVLAPFGILLCGKMGAEENYFLELIAVSAAACGFLAGNAGGSGKRALILALAAQFFLFLPFKPAAVFTRTYGQEIPAATSVLPGAAQSEAGDIILGEMMSAPDPVLSEDIGYPLMAGRSLILDPYQFARLAARGRWDDSRIVEMIENKEFGLVLCGAQTLEGRSEYFTPRMMEAIKRQYQVKRIVGDHYILEPAF